jgi:hypothetical protein
MVYLRTLPVVQIIWFRRIGRLVNSEFETIEKEEILASLKVIFRTFPGQTDDI